jgi:hypothetical protein
MRETPSGVFMTDYYYQDEEAEEAFDKTFGKQAQIEQNDVSLIYTDYTGRELVWEQIPLEKAEAIQRKLLYWEKTLGIALPPKTLAAVTTQMPKTFKEILAAPLADRLIALKALDRHIRGEATFFDKAAMFVGTLFGGR